jgi:hypothetical protein
MCSISDVELLEARWRLNWLKTEEMEELATDWLIQGCDSSAVLDIAAGRVEKKWVPGAFGNALKDLLSRELISDKRAGWLVARDIATRILSGEVAPARGAKDIASISERMNDGYPCHPGWLLGFYNLVDDWDSLFWDKPAEYRLRILQEAQELLDLPEPTEVMEQPKADS